MRTECRPRKMIRPRTSTSMTVTSRQMASDDRFFESSVSISARFDPRDKCQCTWIECDTADRANGNPRVAGLHPPFRSIDMALCTVDQRYGFVDDLPAGLIPYHQFAARVSTAQHEVEVASRAALQLHRDLRFAGKRKRRKRS